MDGYWTSTWTDQWFICKKWHPGCQYLWRIKIFKLSLDQEKSDVKKTFQNFYQLGNIYMIGFYVIFQTVFFLSYTIRLKFCRFSIYSHGFSKFFCGNRILLKCFYPFSMNDSCKGNVVLKDYFFLINKSPGIYLYIIYYLVI